MYVDKHQVVVFWLTGDSKCVYLYIMQEIILLVKFVLKIIEVEMKEPVASWHYWVQSHSLLVLGRSYNHATALDFLPSDSRF